MPDYAKALNLAQFEAVTCADQSVLVVAGAGSGKTRTIVYRLAWLAEQGVAPETILLLTFTRKAAREMLTRARALLGGGLEGIPGGTFHSFAFASLRRNPPAWLSGRPFTLMDSADISQGLRQCRDELKIGKRGSSFPKTPTIAAILSKARNKELSVEEVLRRDSFHLLPYAEDIAKLGLAYANLKKAHGLLDYDDLLFELHDLLADNDERACRLRRGLSNILVDEYQDTNLVQARIVRLLAAAPAPPKVMAVGDEAQSIYAFRGANVRNIMDFRKMFPGARIIRLEENYRSTQPILNVANRILAHAPESYNKTLFTQKSGGLPVRKIRPLSDSSEAILIARRVQELLNDHLPHEIAVLFRAGYYSYALENTLRKLGIAFRKYGGLRFVEAAHIKDVLAFARLAINPLDMPAFSRIAAMHKGIGAKTAAKIQKQLQGDKAALARALARFPALKEDLDFIDHLRVQDQAPQDIFEEIIDYYRPRLESLYAEDWPARVPGLEEVPQIAANYASLDLLVADMALDSQQDEDNAEEENCITLSTVHSAKGLEWNAVLLLDLVEDRFPSRHAQARPEDFEEERRLFYVACTRARQLLEIYAPAALYNTASRKTLPVAQSPFLHELGAGCTDDYVEKFDGSVVSANTNPKAPQSSPGREQSGDTGSAICGSQPKMPGGHGYCRHRIFGRGKIVKRIDDEKMQVNFPGFGLKIILSDYLIFED